MKVSYIYALLIATLIAGCGASPTITSTPRVRAENGSIILHDSPGIAPIGMPDAGHSAYFDSSAGFVFEPNGGSITVKYMLILDIKQPLPPDAVLEIHFQEPSDPSKARVVVKKNLPSDTIMIESKALPISVFECKNYWIDVHIYPDSKSVNELGTHVQWDNSSFC